MTLQEAQEQTKAASREYFREIESLLDCETINEVEEKFKSIRYSFQKLEKSKANLIDTALGFKTISTIPLNPCKN